MRMRMRMRIRMRMRGGRVAQVQAGAPVRGEAHQVRRRRQLPEGVRARPGERKVSE